MRFVILVLLSGFISTSSFAQQPPAQKPKAQAQRPEAKAKKPKTKKVSSDTGSEVETSVWMKKKLDYSQAILKGLATGDFETIKTNGTQMRLLNRVEGFVRRRNPRYKMHVRVFENICEEIVEQADQENLAGVTLAFNQLTVNCVNCHRSLRNNASEDKDVAPKAKDGKSP